MATKKLVLVFSEKILPRLNCKQINLLWIKWFRLKKSFYPKIMILLQIKLFRRKKKTILARIFGLKYHEDTFWAVSFCFSSDKIFWP